MATQTSRIFITVAILSMSVPVTLIAQVPDLTSMQNWPAPLYWQPSPAEEQASRSKPDMTRSAAVSPSDVGTQAQTPANALVFVGMTPCRVVDTRGGPGFTGPFGSPSIAGGTSRTIPIPSSTQCSIPSIAQAYSFNITVVPSGFLDYITVWPTGQPAPVASTLNGYVGTVIANAAIVPAGTSGGVNVFASQTTHLIIDINGYYAPQSGITLAQSSAGAPALSFATDQDTGIFSSGTGTLSIATEGVNRFSVKSDGDVDVVGNVNVGGNNTVDGLLSASLIGINTQSPQGQLHIHNSGNYSNIFLTTGSGPEGPASFRLQADSGLIGEGPSLVIFDNIKGEYRMIIDQYGNTGIGVAPGFSTQLKVGSTALAEGISATAGLTGVYGKGGSTGVFGQSFSGDGVLGESIAAGKAGVYGRNSVDGGIGVRGIGLGTAGWAGYFDGRVRVTTIPAPTGITAPICGNVAGDLVQCGGSSLRWKTNVAPYRSGLDIVRKLEPIHFNWRGDGRADFGLGAEDVAKVDPSLTYTDKEGEIAGVRYERLNVLLINAVKEQQEQIERQQGQIDDLRLLVCLDHPQATVCK